MPSVADKNIGYRQHTDDHEHFAIGNICLHTMGRVIIPAQGISKLMIQAGFYHYFFCLLFHTYF